MPYLGNEPFTQYSETKTQVLTGDGTVGPYTLDYEVGSVGDVEVFVNNVRQQGGSSYAYTVSGNQLTMTGAVAASDDFYVVFQGKSTPSGQIPEKQSDGTYTFDADVTFTNPVIMKEDSTGVATALTVSNPNTTNDNGIRIDLDGVDTSENDVTFARIQATYKNHATEKADLDIFRRNDSGTLASAVQFNKDGYAKFEGGITFNGDTAAANRLDDYEEGTFTPTVYGQTTTGVPVYGGQSGYYVKVGQHVTVSFYINVTSWTTAPAGPLRFNGMPFACNNFQSAMGNLMTDDLNHDYSGHLSIYFAAGTTNPYLYWSRDNAGWATQSVTSEAMKFYATITYRSN